MSTPESSASGTLPDMFSLDGKVAVVTGASSGLGVAFARGLAEAGADLVLGARRVDRLAETAALVEAAGRRALCVETDVSRPEDCDRIVALAMEEFGHVDVLVNNAGIGTAVPATRESVEQFTSVIDVNLNGCYWMAQACGRVMQPGSSIIVTSSVQAFEPSPNLIDYAMTKAAQVAFVRALAEELGPKGVRVNAVAPGPIWTPLNVATRVSEDYVEFGANTPLGRAGQPSEVAGAFVFLASPAEASYVSGTVLGVTGGKPVF